MDSISGLVGGDEDEDQVEIVGWGGEPVDSTSSSPHHDDIITEMLINHWLLSLRLAVFLQALCGR